MKESACRVSFQGCAGSWSRARRAWRRRIRRFRLKQRRARGGGEEGGRQLEPHCDVGQVLREPAVTEEQGDGYELRILLRCGLLGGIDQVIELVTNVQFVEQEGDQPRRPGQVGRLFDEFGKDLWTKSRSPVLKRVRAVS